MECGYDVIVLGLTILRAYQYNSDQMQVRTYGEKLSPLQVLVRDGILYFWLAQASVQVQHG